MGNPLEQKAIYNGLMHLLWKRIVTFFDKLEDKLRIHLSHYPIPYSIIGAVGVVLIWKGVWETAEYFPFLFGPASFVLGTIILLMTGLMVSSFIGDSIIMSGFLREKKLVEKTEDEIKDEEGTLTAITRELKEIERDVEEIKREEANRM